MGLPSGMGWVCASATPLARAPRARAETRERWIMAGSCEGGWEPRLARSLLVRSAGGAGYGGTRQSRRKISSPCCNRRAFPSESIDARMATNEEVEAELHDLFVRGQAGDAAAYHAFLRRL